MAKVEPKWNQSPAHLAAHKRRTDQARVFSVVGSMFSLSVGAQQFGPGVEVVGSHARRCHSAPGWAMLG